MPTVPTWPYFSTFLRITKRPLSPSVGEEWVGKEDIPARSSHPLNLSQALEMQNRQCWWLLADEKMPWKLKMVLEGLCST